MEHLALSTKKAYSRVKLQGRLGNCPARVFAQIGYLTLQVSVEGSKLSRSVLGGFDQSCLRRLSAKPDPWLGCFTETARRENRGSSDSRRSAMSADIIGHNKPSGAGQSHVVALSLGNLTRLEIGSARQFQGLWYPRILISWNANGNERWG